jgi:hypothetical protein
MQVPQNKREELQSAAQSFVTVDSAKMTAAFFGL